MFQSNQYQKQAPTVARNPQELLKALLKAKRKDRDMRARAARRHRGNEIAKVSRKRNRR